MTDITFQEDAWDDYEWWQSQDRRTLRRINALLKAMRRDPRAGQGKPEQLHGDLTGLWSRRIDERNRLVYRITEQAVVVVQCRSHYGDR